MTRKNIFTLAAVTCIGASACGGDGTVGPPPPPRPPAVAQRVAATYAATAVPIPAGRAGTATALSDSGLVVGWDADSVVIAVFQFPPALPSSYTNGSYSVSTSRAFSWSKTAGYHALPMPPDPLPAGAAYVAAFATAVNARGMIVGALAYLDTTANQFHEAPLVWSGGAARLLPLPAGITHARAIDIDATGSVILVRDQASNAVWTWSAGVGYTQISVGYADYFQPIRLTALGVAGMGDVSIDAPVLLGGALNTTWPQPSGADCSAYAYSWGGAALGWCSAAGSGLLQMAVWPAATRQPTLVATPADSVILTVVSDGGVAAGYTRKGPLTLVAYDAANGVVPIEPRLTNPETMFAPSPIVTLPVAINAHGTILYSARSRGTYVVEPQ